MPSPRYAYSIKLGCGCWHWALQYDPGTCTQGKWNLAPEPGDRLYCFGHMAEQEVVEVERRAADDPPRAGAELDGGVWSDR